MKKVITTTLFLFILSYGFSQNNTEIIGNWKFNSVTTTNPSCKEVDYFPIHNFIFTPDGIVELKSEEGIAKANFKLNGNIIELNNLSKNGFKQEGTAQFLIKSISSNTLILTVEYECGSINIIGLPI